MLQINKDRNDYKYIEKLKDKSERQLLNLKESIKKRLIKIEAEKEKLDLQFQENLKKEHFVKDALMDLWRTPNQELLKAIEEVQKGEVETYKNYDEYERAMNNDI